MSWLLYGAYGFTGRLLAEEAVRRGHRPILAGRDGERLRALAQEMDCPHRVFPLDDPFRLQVGLRQVRAVLHAAGPFVETSAPMLDACLSVGAHYLDITGEVPVFEAAFDQDARARDEGVIVMPGVGLDVVPTDGAAALLHRALPTARRLELALHSPGRPSTGTLETVVEGVPGGLLVRRKGRLQGARPGDSGFRREVDFGPEETDGPMAGRLGGRRSVIPATWGDLATAWRTTGIPDITCYLTAPRRQVQFLPLALPVLRGALKVGPLRRLIRRRLAQGTSGPDAATRAQGRTRVWGRAEDDEGQAAEIVLELPEGYRFTAVAGVRALEGVLELAGGGRRSPAPAGVLTPAGALGPEWVLGLPEVTVVRESRTASEERH